MKEVEVNLYFIWTQTFIWQELLRLPQLSMLFLPKLKIICLYAPMHTLHLNNCQYSSDIIQIHLDSHSRFQGWLGR